MTSYHIFSIDALNGNISCHNQKTTNVTTISDFWPLNVNEGSQNCGPTGVSTPMVITEELANARSTHLPILKVNKKKPRFGPG